MKKCCNRFFTEAGYKNHQRWKHSQPQESWEEDILKCLPVIPNIIDKDIKFWKNCGLINFIRTLLSAQKKEWMDVSSWKNLGEKYGYFKFFENKIKKEIIEGLPKKYGCLPEKLDNITERDELVSRITHNALIDEIIKRLK
jgi:hypothetical protein